MKDQRITDPSDLRKYRTELPNLYDDANLDVYEFRLLAHYKRVGTCTEGTATTARKCHMSTGKVSEARQELGKMGWIQLTTVDIGNGNFSYSIIVIDKWLQNFQTYSPSLREATPSPGEDPPSPGEDPPSPGETKKEPIKKEPLKKEVGAKTPTPPRHPAIDVYREKALIFPDKAQWPAIERAIPNDQEALGRWGRVVEAYILCGWHKRNVGAMVEFFKRGEIPSVNGSGHKGHKRRNGRDGIVALGHPGHPPINLADYPTYAEWEAKEAKEAKNA